MENVLHQKAQNHIHMQLLFPNQGDEVSLSQQLVE